MTTNARRCLALLRDAEDLLLASDEHILAAHLSLVIERLAERLPLRLDRSVQLSV